MARLAWELAIILQAIRALATENNAELASHLARSHIRACLSPFLPPPYYGLINSSPDSPQPPLFAGSCRLTLVLHPPGTANML